jgi:opacity protein-like surface antigen
MIKKTKLALGLMATFGVAAMVSTPVSADKLSDLQMRIAKLEGAKARQETTPDDGHMVFFRGGGAANFNDREDDALAAGAGKKGWNVGAGFDFNLNDNLFGLYDDTEVLAELMFDYKDFGEGTNAALDVGTTVATVSQMTVSASPKIKFFKGYKLRPWVIPMGFAINVVSPTSDGVTYLKPSMHFGLGADYHVWESFYVGADLRFNLGLAGASDDEINIDGLTAGAYLGIGF